MTQVDTNIVLS